MSKSVAFLYLPSRFPTMHGHQGFVYGKETRGLVQCYQFVLPNQYAIFGVVTPKKIIGYRASKFTNRSGTNNATAIPNVR